MDRILIIDNVVENLELMVTYLRNAEYDAITAIDSATGIKKANMFKPALVVLDLNMPKISGFDILKTLKQSDGTKDIIVLAVTSIPTKESRNRAFQLGADEYMDKTFDSVLFLAKIKALLRVKHLSDKLKENYAKIEEQSKQFEIQLEMARHVQTALVGKVDFVFNGVSFASEYLPAQEVSGDIYDIIPVEDDTIAVFLADVSGHGVSAALLTSMLKMMFRNAVENYSNPHNIMRELNEQFCTIFKDTSLMIYACAFYAIINTTSKTMVYTSAGSAPPIFLNNASRAVTELDVRGRPLGMMRDSTYSSITVHYDIGDMFVFQTDGLCDSFYKSDSEAFSASIKNCLLDLTDEKSGNLTGKEILEHIINQFYNISEDAENDDISVIVCRVLQ